MNITEQLRLWGTTHAAARAAEHAAHGAGAQAGISDEARQLRERANRLHSEIYSSLGSKGERPGSANRPR